MPEAALRRAGLSSLEARAKDRAPSPRVSDLPPWGEGRSEPESDGQVSRHHREAERGARHRRRAGRLPGSGRLLRERRLRRDLRRRPSLRAAAARGDRSQVQALDPRRAAHPSQGVQVQGQEGPDRPDPHHQEAARARGRERGDQRLRRGARGRADLPRDRRGPRLQEADPPPVAAVDDAGRDPRRLRGAAAGPRARGPGQRGRLPRALGLADRDERHARAHQAAQEPQGEDGLVGGARADAHPGDAGRARARDPGARAAPLLAGQRQLRARGRALHRRVVRPGFRRRRRRGSPRRPDLRRGARAGDPGACRGPARHRRRDAQALEGIGAAALRSHQPPARGQPPLRLVGAAHALGRPAALRAPQAADLSAHRLALPAERLPRDGARDARHLRRRRPARGRGLPGLGERRRAPAPGRARERGARLRRRRGLGPLRDHPDRNAARRRS